MTPNSMSIHFSTAIWIRVIKKLLPVLGRLKMVCWKRPDFGDVLLAVYHVDHGNLVDLYFYEKFPSANEECLTSLSIAS